MTSQVLNLTKYTPRITQSSNTAGTINVNEGNINLYVEQSTNGVGNYVTTLITWFLQARESFYFLTLSQDFWMFLLFPRFYKNVSNWYRLSWFPSFLAMHLKYISRGFKRETCRSRSRRRTILLLFSHEWDMRYKFKRESCSWQKQYTYL